MFEDDADLNEVASTRQQGRMNSQRCPRVTNMVFKMRVQGVCGLFSVGRLRCEKSCVCGLGVCWTLRKGAGAG